MYDFNDTRMLHDLPSSFDFRANFFYNLTYAAFHSDLANNALTALPPGLLSGLTHLQLL
jgi:hypothetical protein